MPRTTRKQRESLKIEFTTQRAISQRNRTPLESYLSFRRRVQSFPCDDCVMIQRGSMWIGIETDGYAHS